MVKRLPVVSIQFVSIQVSVEVKVIPGTWLKKRRISFPNFFGLLANYTRSGRNFCAKAEFPFFLEGVGGGGLMRLLESTNEFNPESVPSVSFQKYETSYVQNEFVDLHRYLSNRDFKIQRCGRQRERQKNNRFYKQKNNFASDNALLHISLPVFARLQRENA